MIFIIICATVIVGSLIHLLLYETRLGFVSSSVSCTLSMISLILSYRALNKVKVTNKPLDDTDIM